MSSYPIDVAKGIFGGSSEAETLHVIAQRTGCRRIYKYANPYGDKRTHTDYKVIDRPGDYKESELLSSPLVHNLVLVYDDGRVLL